MHCMSYEFTSLMTQCSCTDTQENEIAHTHQHTATHAFQQLAGVLLRAPAHLPEWTHTHTTPHPRTSTFRHVFAETAKEHPHTRENTRALTLISSTMTAAATMASLTSPYLKSGMSSSRSGRVFGSSINCARACGGGGGGRAIKMWRVSLCAEPRLRPPVFRKSSRQEVSEGPLDTSRMRVARSEARVSLEAVGKGKGKGEGDGQGGEGGEGRGGARGTRRHPAFDDGGVDRHVKLRGLRSSARVRFAPERHQWLANADGERGGA